MTPFFAAIIDESVLQMRCILCSAAGHSETTGDTNDFDQKDKNPGHRQGYVAACHPEDAVGKVEAAGRQLNFSSQASEAGDQT